MPRLSVTLAALSALAIGCAGGGRGGPDGGATCATDLDCDDGFECTIDSCGVGNLCRWDTISERCDEGYTCEVGAGCIAGMTCNADADCNDAIECTLDSCGVGNLCSNRPIDERCAPGEVCSPDDGCGAPAGCGGDAECDDGVACTQDSCGVDRSCRNTPLNELCTGEGERCSATVGCFVPMPCDTAADCDDGNFCNGDEICDPEFGCSPAEEPRVCNDADDCTVDACDADANRCVFACDPTRAECGCAPDATCAGTFSFPMGSGSACSGLVTWNFTSLTFTNTAGVIEINGAMVNAVGTPNNAPMADPGPACPSVNASKSVRGGCTETYVLTGDFTDDNTFVGELQVSFVGADCAILACANSTMAMNGTRVGS